jgi:hypothetical protein
VPLYNKLKQLSDVKLPTTSSSYWYDSHRHVHSAFSNNLATAAEFSKFDTMSVRLPVVFKSKNATKDFNRQPDGRGGEGDSIGVWKEGNVAWKVVKNR